MVANQSISAATKGRRSFRLGGYLPLIPPVTILLLFFALPVGMMIGLSLHTSVPGTFGLQQYHDFFTDDLALDGLRRTLVLSGIVALCVTTMAYPIAYYLARSTSRWRAVVFGIAIAPELAGVVLRTYGWLVILEKNGFINNTLMWMGLIQSPLPLMNNMFGAVVGLTHVLLPFGILSLLTSLQGVDRNLEKAAQILGASRLSVLRYVVFPLSLPGIISSFLIAFTLSASAYATPALLGGMKFRVLATMIYHEVMVVVDWPAAAAMAIVLLIIVLCIAFISARAENRIVSKLHVR
ncbi:ABC transporter permease (plasmid) [Agrobacterium leguminum]|uniref:ABC-type spermidine/putrescine transport system, permease component I n=1 Tax=Agrobacterium deltaense NCPPB 1641 TaxID=1183425 RepID=A0A1S7UAZ2_9HYPH|nr:MULTISPECIES: ABC transporter permease [Agrobacterium]WFS69663.1 ABC transporter permease [Agrobacterium leguminum]CVI63741.1 ABC-type spermidine/putrescine transport system, permease component I [Agrobacterium deltaense NCPPB 1641]